MICEKILSSVNNENISSICGFFFIVEHTNDNSIVEEYAKSIISQIPSCSVEFDFFGQYAEQWELAFDLADVMLRSENPNNKVALTSVYKNLESFKDALEEFLSYQSENATLFYDDESILKEAIGSQSL